MWGRPPWVVLQFSVCFSELVAWSTAGRITSGLQASSRKNEWWVLLVYRFACLHIDRIFRREKKRKQPVCSLLLTLRVPKVSQVLRPFFGVCCSALWLARIFSSGHLFVNLVYWIAYLPCWYLHVEKWQPHLDFGVYKICINQLSGIRFLRVVFESLLDHPLPVYLLRATLLFFWMVYQLVLVMMQ